MTIDDSVVATILSEVQAASVAEAEAYLAGAARDGTFSRLHATTRISQANVQWLHILQALLQKIGRRGWIYRESNREVWTIETRWHPAEVMNEWTQSQRLAFSKGYFDAEGGIPTGESSRFYIQLVQKDRSDLERLRRFLLEVGIRSGRLHNPSWRSDPNYWRFYVLAASHRDFIRPVGSWHPRKRPLILGRASPKQRSE